MTHSQLTQAGVTQSGVGRKFPSVCKWQKDRTGSSKHGKMDPWTQDCSRPSGKQQLRISAQLSPPSLRIFQGAATAALASQVQAGFYSTFSLWDEATSHLAPWALLSWRAPVNDPLHLGDCWAKVQIQSCHLTTITPFSGNWSVFLWALNKHDIVHVTKYVEWSFLQNAPISVQIQHGACFSSHTTSETKAQAMFFCLVVV